MMISYTIINNFHYDKYANHYILVFRVLLRTWYNVANNIDIFNCGVLALAHSTVNDVWITCKRLIFIDKVGGVRGTLFTERDIIH